MDEESDRNIGGITTVWEDLAKAHGRLDASADSVARAQQVLIERYQGAVRRYLLAALRDRHAADEVFAQFALRFLQGAFRNADPEKGRFRDFVKKALSNLIKDYQWKRGKEPLPFGDRSSSADPAAPPEPDLDREFVESWRSDVLERAWSALETASRAEGNHYHRVLWLKATYPETSSQQMAERIGRETGEPRTEDWVRQTLKRAREKFSILVLDDLARSLGEPTRESVEQELIDLGLHSYCRRALDKWRPNGPV
jgi:RNA polymerase sigma-70 factor (ECF subfamily)